MPGVVIKGLFKRYGDVGAVDGLDLEVKPGELVALLGPSGCGKTTTLRVVAGFLKPDAGEVWVGERCLSSAATVIPPERRRMAMIFQSYALWPHMTVAQNVAYGLKFAGVPRSERDRRVKAMLQVVQLPGYEARYPGELSGGQQQRIAVARALVVEPEILLLDEPLSNLDASLREEMRFEIRRLHEAFNITTLYVTHDQAEAMVIADRVAVLERGRVAQIGRADELYEAPSSRFVAEFIGKTNLVEGRAEDADTFTRGRMRIRIDGAVALAGRSDDPVDPPSPDRAASGRAPTTPRGRRSARSAAPSFARATSATRWTTRSRSPTPMSSSGSPAPPPPPPRGGCRLASRAAGPRAALLTTQARPMRSLKPLRSRTRSCRP